MVDFASLDARYGIPGEVKFKEGPAGLAVAAVTNAYATATIERQGAQVLNWTPRGEQPVIWLSAVAKFASGKLIRGGVPVCWPWFGPHPTEPSFPWHVFARIVPWEPAEIQRLADGSTRIAFRLVQNEATLAQWPHSTPVELHINVGAVLELNLVTRNIGQSPVTIGGALHSYFQVSDIRQVRILGLDACPYLDRVDACRRKQQAGPVMISAETDRIYLEATADCLIEDQGLNRRIGKRGNRSTVVWNPWVDKAARMGDIGEDGYLRMVCVESANVADDVVTIASGDEHHLWARYSIERLG